MNNGPKRICNRATASLEQLAKIIGDLQKKIQTQGEELRRKDEYIKQLKYERDIRIDPFVTGITTTYGEPKEFVEVVRCKDCVWFRHGITGNGFCEKWDDFFTDHDGYCYRGERRKNE